MKRMYKYLITIKNSNGEVFEQEILSINHLDAMYKVGTRFPNSTVVSVRWSDWT
jgi:hypothetical protein